MGIDISEALSNAQREAVLHDGNVVAVAAPGAGKTRVVVERAKRLLVTQEKNIKLGTFTRAAAAEMKARIGEQGKGRVEAATFDSYCLRAAKEIKGFSAKPPNSFQDRACRARTLRELGIPISQDSHNFLDELLIEAGSRLEPDAATPDAIRAYTIYSKILDDKGLMDHAGIARLVVRGMMEGAVQALDGGVLIVDEFQDADELQLQWVLEHARRGLEVMVVGDDDQSIYGWRGGLGHRALEVVREQTGAKLIKLGACYRCRPEIVEAARILVGHNRDRYDKQIFSPRPLGGSVEVRRCPVRDGEDGGKGAGNKRVGALDKVDVGPLIVEEAKGCPEGRIAILGRRNAELDNLACWFLEREIPVQRLGGKPMWETEGAQAALALTDLLMRRNIRAALSSVLNWAGIGNRDIKIALARPARDWAGIRAAIENPTREGAVILEWIEKHDGASSRDARAALVAIGTELKGCKIDEKGGLWGGAMCLAALRALIRHLDRNPGRSLAMAVKRLLEGARRAQGDESTARYVIATMHAAKGLEWPSVFIVHAVEGVTPKVDEDAPEEAVEEERRLFYVAMTRAEEKLVIFTAAGFPDSRFIKEARLRVTPGEPFESEAGAGPQPKGERAALV